MRNLLIAAAALLALAIPTTPAFADRGHHWRSGGPAMHWRGPVNHRVWHLGPVFRHRAWAGHPGWRWRHRPRVVIVRSFGWGPSFGWGAPCPRMWFDGWGWRCGW
jgi:hypothetical protein